MCVENMGRPGYEANAIHDNTVSQLAGQSCFAGHNNNYVVVLQYHVCQLFFVHLHLGLHVHNKSEQALFILH